MILFGLQNANASTIAVTNTATLLKTLIDTAGSVTHVFPGGLNGIDLFVEDGDVRILFDGNAPTASKGLLLKQGTIHHFRAVDFHQARLIRTGSANVAVSVQIGFVEDNEEVTNSAGGGSGGATDNAAAPASASLAAGKYNASAPTYDDGDAADLQTDANGNLKVREQYAPGYEDNTNGVAKVEQRFSYSYISSATTTQVKSGAGFLHAIIVGTTAAGAIQIIDNTTGSTVNIGELKSSIVEGTYIFNCQFSTGLRIITAAASKITVIYR